MSKALASEGMADPYYNLISGDRKFGPYSRHELALMLADGEIGLESLCIRVGESEICRLRELFEQPLASRPSTRGPAAWDGPAVEEEVEENDTYFEETGGEFIGEEEMLEMEDDWPEPDESDHPDWDPDEIICSLHPSILGYPRLLLAALILGCLAVVYLILAPYLHWPISPFTDFLVLLAVLTLAWLFVLRHFDNYYITRSRAEVVRGLIARSSNEVRISDVRRIDVDKKGILGLLNVGDVKLSSAGTGGFDIVFVKVRNGHRVKRILRRVQKDPMSSRGKLLGKPWLR